MQFEADLYIPVEGSPLSHIIAPRSAIVGRPLKSEEGVMLYYEGNLYDAANLRKWQERVTCAAGRMFLNYPTVAKTAVLEPNALVCVGTVRTDDPRTPYEVRVRPDQFEALSAYTGEPVDRLVAYEVVFGAAGPEASDNVTIVRGDREMIHATFIAATDGAPANLIALSRAFRALRDVRLRPGVPVELLANGETVAAGRVGEPAQIAVADVAAVLDKKASRAHGMK